MFNEQRLKTPAPDRSRISRPHLAFALLDKSSDGAQTASISAANDDLLIALDACNKSHRASAVALARALGSAEMFLAMRPNCSGTVSGPDGLNMVVLTTRNGRRVLPVFSGIGRFRGFARDDATVCHKLPGAQALQIALVMNFDAIEIDRGSPHCCRIGRRSIDICVEYLFGTGARVSTAIG